MRRGILALVALVLLVAPSAKAGDICVNSSCPPALQDLPLVGANVLVQGDKVTISGGQDGSEFDETGLILQTAGGFFPYVRVDGGNVNSKTGIGLSGTTFTIWAQGSQVLADTGVRLNATPAGTISFRFNGSPWSGPFGIGQCGIGECVYIGSCIVRLTPIPGTC